MLQLLPCSVAVNSLDLGQFLSLPLRMPSVKGEISPFSAVSAARVDLTG